MKAMGTTSPSLLRERSPEELEAIRARDPEVAALFERYDPARLARAPRHELERERANLREWVGDPPGTGLLTPTWSHLVPQWAAHLAAVEAELRRRQ